MAGDQWLAVSTFDLISFDYFIFHRPLEYVFFLNLRSIK